MFLPNAAISKRIHYGKFVAEIKFLEKTEKYTELIKNKDAEGLMELLTNKEVEQKVLKRVRIKSLTYGRDLDDEVFDEKENEIRIKISKTETSSHKSDTEGEKKHSWDRYKVDPDAIIEIYRDYIIPLTKEVEVDYLMQRLGYLSLTRRSLLLSK